MAKRRTYTLFLFALVLGLGAAFLANKWIKQQLSTTSTAESDSVPVVVAALEIPFGQKLEATHVKVIQWPKTNVPEGSFRDIPEVEGKIVNQKFFPGEVLIAGRVVTHGQGSTLSAVISQDKRAVTVRVNDVIGVAGFLLPGNRVDILGSVKRNKKMTTKIFLEDIKVLAVDQTASPEKDKPLVVRAVTLEVDTAQAEKLVNATKEGSVQLALRNPTDDSRNKAVQVAVKKPQTVRRKAVNSLASITVIRGTHVNVVKGRF